MSFVKCFGCLFGWCFELIILLWLVQRKHSADPILAAQEPFADATYEAIDLKNYQKVEESGDDNYSSDDSLDAVEDLPDFGPKVCDLLNLCNVDNKGGSRKFRKWGAGTPSFMIGYYVFDWEFFKNDTNFYKKCWALVVVFLNLIIKQFEFMKRQWTVWLFYSRQEVKVLIVLKTQECQEIYLVPG